MGTWRAVGVHVASVPVAWNCAQGQPLRIEEEEAIGNWFQLGDPPRGHVCFCDWVGLSSWQRHRNSSSTPDSASGPRNPHRDLQRMYDTTDHVPAIGSILFGSQCRFGHHRVAIGEFVFHVSEMRHV
jgi:hypothetical protein